MVFCHRACPAPEVAVRPLVRVCAVMCLVVCTAGCSPKAPVDPDLPGGCILPPGNHAPVFAALHDTTASVGDTLWVRATAYDADGDPLQYRALVSLAQWHPPWLPLTWFDRSTGVFAYVPQTQDGVLLDVTFSVDDGRCGRAERQIQILIASQSALPASTGIGPAVAP